MPLWNEGDLKTPLDLPVAAHGPSEDAASECSVEIFLTGWRILQVPVLHAVDTLNLSTVLPVCSLQMLNLYRAPCLSVAVRLLCTTLRMGFLTHRRDLIIFC